MSAAATLAARVEQYLAERRRLGFQLRTMAYSLHSLVEHVRRTRHRGALTIELMAAWARQAQQGAGTHVTWARRLRRLRPFTRWLQQFEPATEVPDESISPSRAGRRRTSTAKTNSSRCWKPPVAWGRVRACALR